MWNVMGNALNLFPGEERGASGNQLDLYNTPPPFSTHSHEGDYVVLGLTYSK